MSDKKDTIKKVNGIFDFLKDNNINVKATVLNGNVNVGDEGINIGLVPVNDDMEEIEDTEDAVVLLEEPQSIKTKSRKASKKDND